MLNEKALRKKLSELGIPTWGTKQQLIKRHQEWLNIYNSNCDASDNARKSKREMLRELEEWERTQGGSANVKESMIMRKDFDGSIHATTYKNQFDDLIANAKKLRAKATQKASEPHDEATSSGTGGTGSQQPTSDPPYPYENNETALATVRQKVDEANRSDSVFPPLNPATTDASIEAAQHADVSRDATTGLSSAPENPFASPTRKVPMFKMPEEPVVDVESSTTIQ